MKMFRSSPLLSFRSSVDKSSRVAAAFRRLSSNNTQSVIELREYQLHPEHSAAYLEAASQAAHLCKSLAPLRLFSLPETGGRLHTATHAYCYGGGHAERDEKQSAMASCKEWRDHLSLCRPYIQAENSGLFVEAPFVKSNEKVAGLEDPSEELEGDDCILEVRRYKLILGYDTVPKFLSLYVEGLPSKLAAEGTHPTTSLVTLLYSEVGRLNEVIEIWRHGNGTAAMEQSRVAARGATEWRESIAQIAPLAIEFTSTIHRPTAFSPLR